VIPDTPAGRQAAWYLSLIEQRGEPWSLVDRERLTPDLQARQRPAASDDELPEEFRRLSEQLGPVKIGGVEATGDHGVAVLLDAADGKRWRLACQVEREPPHRISHLELRRALDPSVTARLATEADGPALADLERRCPIELDDSRVTIDRGDDWWAFARLMEAAGAGLALVDGVLAGVNCGGVHPVRIGGQDYRLMVAIHLRVLPEHQRKGLWGAATEPLNGLFPWGEAVDASIGYVSAQNLKMQAGFRHNPNKWSFGPTRVVLDCRELAGPAMGRPATAADAGRIVQTLNDFHHREEMFLPYTQASLTARLQRAPDLYSWDSVQLTDGAVVGVWPAGDKIRLITESAGNTTITRRDLVADYCWVPGAEDEFEALVRHWCGHAAARGAHELAIFTSQSSPGFELLRTLAQTTEDFVFWLNGVPEPADARSRGVYTDPFYF
jgi:hypothetical protein